MTRDAQDRKITGNRVSAKPRQQTSAASRRLSPLNAPEAVRMRNYLRYLAFIWRYKLRVIGAVLSG
ncbi:MAG TPA: hypothetical protein P5118_17070, partial [Planctomycetota bacterium]|nr:hypothetical protein [Planctomycetota bacterium]